MRKKMSLAGIGALLIMGAIYFFPFGQDIVMLWLTKQVGSQHAAWVVMYFICFALLFAGALMGGAKYLGAKKLGTMFRLLTRNPLVLMIALVVTFLIFNYLSGLI